MDFQKVLTCSFPVGKSPWQTAQHSPTGKIGLEQFVAGQRIGSHFDSPLEPNQIESHHLNIDKWKVRRLTLCRNTFYNFRGSMATDLQHCRLDPRTYISWCTGSDQASLHPVDKKFWLIYILKKVFLWVRTRSLRYPGISSRWFLEYRGKHEAGGCT